MRSMPKSGRVVCAVSMALLWGSGAAGQEAPPDQAPPAEEPKPPAEPPPAPEPAPQPSEPPAPPPEPPAEPPPAPTPAPAPEPTAPAPSTSAFPPVPLPAPAPSPAKAPVSPAPAAQLPAKTNAPPPPPPQPTAKNPPPKPAQPASNKETTPPPEEEEEHAFRIGPLLGLGLPSVFSIGGTLKLTRYIGAGVTFGIIPTLRLSYYGDAVLSYHQYDIYGRIYPFGGGFFLGAGAGYVTVQGTLSKTIDISAYAVPGSGLPNSLEYESKGSVRTLVLTPVLGYLYTFGSGFSLGFDAGVQFPIAPSEVDFESKVQGGVPQAVVDQYLGPVDKSVRDTLQTIGRTPLPTFNLRIGWLL
ncbi:MAG TPA: hypothetical protein VGP93_13320 [Polyangiaceae bacterium]|nr:hypothetical protein [Polyangiaceae bacterium]